MPYLKVITTARFLVSPEVISATLKLTIIVAKKLQDKRNYIDCIRCYEYYRLQRYDTDF